MHAGYYFSLFSVPVYLFVEDTFCKRLFRGPLTSWVIINLIIYFNVVKLRLLNFYDFINFQKKFLLWNAKMFQFSYWGLAFQVKNSSTIWAYGVSIYFAPYIVAFVMYCLAVLLN